MAIESRHARYPFTEAARAAVEAADVDLVSAVERSGPILERAVERVEQTVETGETGDPHRRPRVELLSYPVARVLISLVGEPALTDKYARAEATTAAERFRSDLGGSGETLKSSRTEPITLAELLAEFDLDTAVWRGDDSADDAHAYRIAVGPYLELAAGREGDRWRLVNRRLADGSLPVSRDELLTLLEEAVRVRVAEGLPLSVPDQIADALAPQRDRLREELADVDVPRRIDTVVPELFPDCLQAMIDRVRDGESLETQAQFVLVSFLTGVGLTPDGLVAFLDRSDGSDAAQLRHYAEHVSGDASATQYAPPSCATIRSYGLCADNDCGSAANPLVSYQTVLGTDGGEFTDWRDREHTETGPTPDQNSESELASNLDSDSDSDPGPDSESKSGSGSGSDPAPGSETA